MPTIKLSFKHLLFALSFIEGGAVMTCELAGAKLLAPIFGTSLYVWAAVLGVTLGALSLGYYLGGLVASRNRTKRPDTLFFILVVAGLFVAAMPLLGAQVFKLASDWGVRSGSILSLMVYMFPPLMLFGMTSPVIIGLLTSTGAEAGRNAGSIYAISTVGGILFTFLTGFYLLPEKGIKFTVLLVGMGMAIIPMGLLVIRKKLMVLALGLLFLFFASYQEKSNSIFKTLYRSDGIYGQVKVVDFWSPSAAGNTWTRALMVNNQSQTVIYPEHPDFDYWSYTAFMPKVIKLVEPKKVLLMGLGGGTLLNRLHEQGYEVDVVEIDKRIKEVAIEYFGVSPGTNIAIEDGRRFINTVEEKYDLVIFDVFSGETPPLHLYTLECFNEVQKILKPGGELFVNFYGFWEGERGEAAKAVAKTLEASFPEVKVFASVQTSDERSRNLLLVAGTKLEDTFSGQDAGYVNSLEIKYTSAELESLPVLSDNLPVLEKLYIKPALEWRKFSREYFINKML